MSKEVYRSGDDRAVIEDTGKGGNLVDIYLTGKGDDQHCHYWVDPSGQSGMEHRGECDECQDPDYSDEE